MRSHLLAWVNAGGLNSKDLSIRLPLASLSQLAGLLPEPKLQAALAELDARLYSPQQNSAYNGQNLLALLKEQQRQSGKTETQRAVLYPH
ncbi:hypothetical protein [Thalassolituus sp. UBA2009]|uniref:BatD family protein n=1 Tax=Thalassolituus sp. UBA2009 TaxID=1947658 RepID=UPI00257C3B21|nr:hypothetical protein [Thalassolituus sp. UBA2009]